MPKFSIIIPVCNNENLTQKCLETIKECSDDYEVIIVDNGSVPPYSGSERVIRNESNLGFPIAVNQGLKEATGDILVILNNDTLVTPGWLDNLAEHLKTFDLVGPCSNYVSGLQQVATNGYKNKSELYEFAKEQRDKNLGSIISWYRLVFFCVAFKREVLNKIGFLDEQFSPGNFEDDDYCLRAIEAGFKLGIAFDVFIHHIGSVTHKSLNLDFKKLLETNQAKFKNKWSDSKYQELQDKALESSPAQLLNPKSGLSLVMIVRNEARGIERAILSCRGLVREIVIAIDNSTTDETEVIAKKYATTIKHFDFKDDFSAARNFAQEGVSTRWVLFLDGHEYIKQAPDLQDALKQDCNGLLCTIEMETGSQFRNPRIIERDVKFAGAIHEQQQCNKILPYLKFIIKHDRTNSQSREADKVRAQQRDRQMPEIMGKLLKNNPKDTRAAFHLFLYYSGRGRFREAKKCQKLFLKYAKVRGDRWFVFFNQALSYLMRRKYFRAYMATCAAEKETPDRWEISKLRGTIFLSQRNYVRALDFLVSSFDENTGDQTFKPWQRDFARTWDLIGECFFNLGRYYEASEAFRAGVQFAENKDFKDLLLRRSELMFKMAGNLKV